MWFWFLAAALAAVATLALVVPLLRRPASLAQGAAYDREIYLARLREIDTDLELGRIAASEAEAARAEEGRRLLAAANSEAPEPERQSVSLARPLAYAMLVVLPLSSVAMYFSFGQPGMPDMELAERQDRDPAQQSLEMLLSRAEAQLQRQPDDIRGWVAVAPVYLRMGRYEDAARAWRNAVRLEENNVDYRSSYAEALVAVASGVVTEEARVEFQNVLDRREGDPKASFYLAVGLAQQGALDEAETAWRKLIDDSPQGAPWLPSAREQLVAVLERAGKPVDPELVAGNGAGNPAPGPDREQIEAAAQMDAGDRQEMIEGMVDRLASRMREEPGDKEGWLRLIRAYGVLGKMEEGRAAIENARTHFASDEAFLGQLDQLAQGFATDGATQ